jgi:FKBP-type peptidyl-prolyl cis-trans isomerase
MFKHPSRMLTMALPMAALLSLVTPAALAETIADVTPAVAVATPVNVTTPSGLSYMITKQAKGRHAQAGDMFYSNYTLLLTNGKKIDSSFDHGQPFGFAVGAGHVIKGMDEVALKLGLGDEAVVVIPSSLGYGDKGVGPIPPGATLVFLMQVVEIRSK